MNKHIIFIVIIAILVGSMLSLLGLYRYNDFRSYHEVIARESVNNLANDIALFISERKRWVQLFGENNINLLKKITENPDNIELEEVLRTETLRFFPNHFSRTVANEKGQLFLEDYDGLMGEMCFSDIRHFADSQQNAPRVHPHLEVYHFDIMSSLDTGRQKIILFISFPADILANAVKSAEVSGHRLLLTYPSGNGLIEVVAQGARNVLRRKSYILEDAESNRQLAMKAVAGTSWFARDFYEPDLFINQRNAILTQFLLIYAAFLLACVIMLVYLVKEERRRKQAENHKDDFLSLVSHELRTPLTALNGAIGLVLHGVAGTITTKARELLGMAQHNGTRLTLLVNDLLDLQKIEAGKMTYIKTQVPINEVVQRAIEGCQQYAEQYQITYKFISASLQATSEIYVNIDQNRIIQVLFNLLSNAAKYGAKNDIVEIELKEIENKVMISVIDHGAGIPEDLKDNLFEQFTRAEQHVGSSIAGTGLGLNISKRIIDAHEGSIGHYSSNGSTCFYITLPVSRVG